MNILTLKVGSYLVRNISMQIIDGRPSPVAEVQFKEHNWSRMGDNLYQIRLRGLYYSQSEGPKEIEPSKLLYLIINILKIEYIPSSTSKTGLKGKITWSVTKPNGYDEVKLEEEQIANDILLAVDPELEQIENDFLLAVDPELQQIENDFLLADAEDSNIVNSMLGEQIVTEANGVPDDEDIPF